MPKKRTVTPIDLESSVMSKVRSNEISMKPKWHFLLGSVLLIAGLAASTVAAIFLTNLTLFLLRQHGPMGQWRLQMMLESFPVWVPLIALVGMVIGILLLKNYDFSYKKNFGLLILGFIASVILAALILSYLNLDKMWYRNGPMRRLYQQDKNPEVFYPMRQGNGWRKNFVEEQN